MADSNNVVFLILDSINDPYPKLRKCIQDTWVSNLIALNVPYYYYQGSHKENEIIGNDIKLIANDNCYTEKFVDSLLLLNKGVNDNRYLIRCNLSTYVNVPKTLKLISYLSKNKIDYAGAVGKDLESGISFMSGTMFILSPIAIKYIIDKKDLINRSRIDDVAIGELLSHLPMKFNFSYLNLNSKNWKIKAKIFHSIYFHFRCKSSKHNNQRNADFIKMHFVHKLFVDQ